MASGDDGAGKKAKGNEERTDDTWLTVVDRIRPDDAARAILPVIATQPEVDLDVHVDPVGVTAGGPPPPWARRRFPSRDGEPRSARWRSARSDPPAASSGGSNPRRR